MTKLVEENLSINGTKFVRCEVWLGNVSPCRCCQWWLCQGNGTILSTQVIFFNLSIWLVSVIAYAFQSATSNECVGANWSYNSFKLHPTLVQCPLKYLSIECSSLELLFCPLYYQKQALKKHNLLNVTWSTMCSNNRISMPQPRVPHPWLTKPIASPDWLTLNPNP
jgi:hypothetical protein